MDVEGIFAVFLGKERLLYDSIWLYIQNGMVQD